MPATFRSNSHIAQLPRLSPYIAAVLALTALLFAACDHGLEPPGERPPGAIRGTIVYSDLSTWPPGDVLVDLRFFALPFVPRDTLDLFRDLNRLVFSDPLQRNVVRDTFFVANVPAQTYLYSGVAQQFSPALFDWRPVGLYSTNGGVFVVRPGEATELAITVDFNDPPPFPPAPSPGIAP